MHNFGIAFSPTQLAAVIEARFLRIMDDFKYEVDRPVEDMRKDVDRRLIRDYLEVVIDECLTPLQASTVRLHFFDEMSLTDIGAIQGCSPQNVHICINRSLSKLKKKMAAEF